MEIKITISGIDGTDLSDTEKREIADALTNTLTDNLDFETRDFTITITDAPTR